MVAEKDHVAGIRLLLHAAETQQRCKGGSSVVNESNNFGSTALHCAVTARSVGAVKLLVKHGANIHKRRKDGATPMNLATDHAAGEAAL